MSIPEGCPPYPNFFNALLVVAPTGRRFAGDAGLPATPPFDRHGGSHGPRPTP
jgi:hypothetical protein